MKTKRVVAIYLPQFHPTKENDEWWGKGFTEWTNVTKAYPRFKGHYQPHLPADLGFYDLRLEEVREEQAQMAKKYGIDGFCYYHYWFNGRQLLDRPLKEVIRLNKPDFPFMLCWANENWTKVWDGTENAILMQQNYSFEDDLNHIKYLIPIFKDKRYIKVDGKPVFCIYRSDLFPDMKRTIEIWRQEAFKEGMELYLCRFESFSKEGTDYLNVGFDAAIEFQPHSSFKYFRNIEMKYCMMRRIRNKLGSYLFNTVYPTIIPYKAVVEANINRVYPSYKLYPCVTPGWDNSSRRKKGEHFLVMNNSTPKDYYDWLNHALEFFKPFSLDENFLFINAWNEWAEGNHLEPDRKWGQAYLEMTYKAILETCGQ